MKIFPFKIPKPEHDALVYQEDVGVSFYDKLHQHEEIQISLIVEGEGTLIVGDTINYYKPNDILVIGSKLPHIFKSDLSLSNNSKMLSLFFTQYSFGNQFFELEELRMLRPFFKRATHGFKMVTHQHRAKKLFLNLKKADKLERFLILIELLKLTSACRHKSLSSFVYDKQYSDNEGNRMRTVFDFTMNNYNEEITLKEIATIANMTKNAFCKYFKKRTNKTYFQFLSELRIEHASKLLLSEKNYGIAEIAYKSGFKNISNFNRKFKAVKNCNPTTFKNEA